MADRTETGTSGGETERIRQGIDRTRADMGETVDELADRLSPGRLLDEVWTRVRAGGSEGFGTVVRDHPIPLALMGLGLGWLAVEQATGHSSDRGGHASRRVSWARSDARAEGRVGPYRGDAVADGPEEDSGMGSKLKATAARAGDAASRATEKASDATASVKERAAGAAATAREKADRAASGASQRASDAATSAADTARTAGRKARRGFLDLMDENPLVVGAVAFGLGLASGVSAPSTSTEDRLVGRTSDTLKDEVKRVGKETTRKAKRVAADAADAAADEARRQREERDIDDAVGESVRHAKDAAKRVAGEARGAAEDVGRAAKEAAVSRAEDEDLTPEGMKREAARAGKRTKEQAQRDAERAGRRMEH